MEFNDIIIGIFCLLGGIFIMYRNWPKNIKRENSTIIGIFISGLGMFLIGIMVVFKMLMRF